MKKQKFFRVDFLQMNNEMYDKTSEIVDHINKYLSEAEFQGGSCILALTSLVVAYCIEQGMHKGHFLSFVSNCWETTETAIEMEKKIH